MTRGDCCCCSTPGRRAAAWGRRRPRTGPTWRGPQRPAPLCSRAGTSRRWPSQRGTTPWACSASQRRVRGQGCGGRGCKGLGLHDVLRGERAVYGTTRAQELRWRPARAGDLCLQCPRVSRAVSTAWCAWLEAGQGRPASWAALALTSPHLTRRLDPYPCPSRRRPHAAALLDARRAAQRGSHAVKHRAEPPGGGRAEMLD